MAKDIKSIIRNFTSKVVGLPGVLRHLLNLESFCNSKFQILEDQIKSLNEKLEETRKAAISNQPLPDISSLFAIPENYYNDLKLADLFNPEIQAQLKNANILEIGSQCGQRAQFLRRFEIASYLGLEVFSELVEFAKQHTPDNRFNFKTLVPDFSLDNPETHYDLIVYLVNKKRFSLEELKINLNFAIKHLSKNGLLIISIPYPIEDLQALGFDLYELFKQANLLVRTNCEVIYAQRIGVANVANG